jgi:hypothetical protein
MTTQQAPSRQVGPPLPAVGIVFVVLFLAGLVISTSLAGGTTYPSPYSAPELVEQYFAANGTAVAIAGFFLLGSAFPLLVFTATATHRLRATGASVPGTYIALVGGVLSAGFLMLSGLFQWALSRPVVAHGPVHLAHALSFGLGGPAYAAAFGLLAAGLSVPALIMRRGPRWVGWLGLAIAAAGMLSTLTLVVPAFAYLIPLTRFPGFVWLIAMAATLRP